MSNCQILQTCECYTTLTLYLIEIIYLYNLW